MKVFISHQKADTTLAGNIANRLRSAHKIDSYLDVIDPNANQVGNELGDYIRVQLGNCTQLLAVVSENTKTSWWVPWEIGIATEKDQPIATFAGDSTPLPLYLKKWPYLKSETELDEYAKVSKEAASSFQKRKGYLTEAQARKGSLDEFYRNLRSKLGQ